MSLKRTYGAARATTGFGTFEDHVQMDTWTQGKQVTWTRAKQVTFDWLDGIFYE